MNTIMASLSVPGTAELIQFNQVWSETFFTFELITE